MTVIFSGAIEGPATTPEGPTKGAIAVLHVVAAERAAPPVTAWGPGGDHGLKRDHDPGRAPGTITPLIGRQTDVGETASGTRGGEKWPDGEINRRGNRTVQMASRDAFVKRFPKHSSIERFVCRRSHSPETTIKLEKEQEHIYLHSKMMADDVCVQNAFQLVNQGDMKTGEIRKMEKFEPKNLRECASSSAREEDILNTKHRWEGLTCAAGSSSMASFHTDCPCTRKKIYIFASNDLTDNWRPPPPARIIRPNKTHWFFVESVGSHRHYDYDCCTVSTQQMGFLWARGLQLGVWAKHGVKREDAA